MALYSNNAQLRKAGAGGLKGGFMDKINEQKRKFLESGIPYDELDKEMIDLIDVLNFKLGLRTRWCCYGHEAGETPSVIFDKSVNNKEKDIYKLAEAAGRDWKRLNISFKKWVRFSPLLINWELVFGKSFEDPHDPRKYENLSDVIKFFEKYSENRSN